MTTITGIIISIWPAVAPWVANAVNSFARS